MEDSILKSTKKILNVPPDYDAFDHDILVSINSALSTLGQLGIGPIGFQIGDDDSVWSSMELSPSMLGLVQVYVYLKARLIFDPPATSFHIEAMKEQIGEHEFRLSVMRDEERLAALNG